MSDLPAVPMIADDDPTAVTQILWYLQTLRNGLSQLAGKALEFADLTVTSIPANTETVIATLEAFPEGGFVVLLGSFTIILDDGETATIRIRLGSVSGTILGGPVTLQGSAASSFAGTSVVGAHLEPGSEQTYVLTVEHDGAGNRDVGNRRLIVANLNLSKGVK